MAITPPNPFMNIGRKIPVVTKVKKTKRVSGAVKSRKSKKRAVLKSRRAK